MAKDNEHFETPDKRGTAIKQGAKNKEPEMTMEDLAAGYARGAELTEQREQSQTTFELCRVATEVGESQGRHDDAEAGRLADDQAGLSYPDKRDCGVSLRAKRTRISRIERIRNYDIERDFQTNGRADLPHTHCGDWRVGEPAGRAGDNHQPAI